MLCTNILAHAQKRIVDGVYQPGDRIEETRPTKELNVSQVSMREVIGRQGNLGGTVLYGLHCAKTDRKDVANIYDVRAHIDEYAASLAAHRATGAKFDAMEHLLWEMDKVADIYEFVQKDILFHAMMVDEAGSLPLSRIWHSLRLAEGTNLSVRRLKIPWKS